MKKIIFFIRWVFIALVIITATSLQAFIFKASLFKKPEFPESSIILLSDVHDLCQKDVNIMQMENFLKNIRSLSFNEKNQINIITESMLLNGINLNNGNETFVAQKFYDTYKFYPSIKKNLLPKFNASTTDLSLINPNQSSISTWITWDLPVKFVKERSKISSSISLDALEPRQKIFFFADILCEHLNHPNSPIKLKISLDDIYDSIDSLLAKVSKIDSLLPLCETKRKQLKAIENIFGNKDKREQVYPENIIPVLLKNKKVCVEFLNLFAIEKKDNEEYRMSLDLMVDDSYLGKNLLEIAIIGMIFARLNNKSSHNITIILAGALHIKSLRFILLNSGFTCMHKFPSHEMKLKVTANDLIGLFDKISIAPDNKYLQLNPIN